MTPSLPPDLLANLSAQDAAFLYDIARRNSGLSAAILPRAQRLEEAAVRLRWKRWLRFGGGHDWRLLRRRMRAEGLRPASLYQPRVLAELPAWAGTLQALRARARQLARQPAELAPLLPPGALTLPFAELLVPCLLLARERLAARHPPRAGPEAVLADTARAGLELALLRRLSRIAAPSLMALFDTQRQTSPMLWALFSQADNRAPQQQYRAFVTEQLACGYQGLGEGWPVALRFLAELVDQWVESTAEFATRLADDYADICQVFFADTTAPGPVVAVDSTLSDPHAGGRTVLRLRFAGGQQLVYKPRPMAMEDAFCQTLRWLNANWVDGRLRQHVPAVLARRDYGWMAWVEAAPMSSSQEAAAYHWRLGSLMAVLRALRGADMHQENLVAAGAYPVFVDVECLLHPSAAPFLEMPEAPQYADRLPRELLHMGILPFYGAADNARGLVNYGGIGKTADERGPQETVYRHVNSDWMHATRQAMAQTTHHQPRTAEGWVNAFAHADAIADGYRDTLEFLLKRREWLLTHDQSPWHALRQAQGRHLARNTWNYGLLLDGATAAEAMTDGIMFDLTFEPLHRHLHMLSPGYRRMAPAERHDLRQLDVPRFGFAGNTRLLYDAYGRALGDMHAETPYDAMAAKLRRLQPGQVHQEAKLLRLVLTEDTAPTDMRLPGLVVDLHRREYRLGDELSLWMSLSHQGDGLGVHPMPPGLYNGTSGLALAMAGAGRVLQCDASRRIADRALRDSLTLLSSQLRQRLLRPNPGYDEGMAGILYAFDACARLSNDQGLHDAAARLARDWLADYRPGEEERPGTRLDLLNGMAGLILVLLRWHRSSPGQGEFLQAARQCGQHLLRQARNESRGISWGETTAAGLSGLSHGNSGFAVALASLYRATGEPAYREAAFAALAYEATLFVPAWGNWRDLRSFTGGDLEKSTHRGCSWCHGAPGIALGRAALLHLLAGRLSPSEREALEHDVDVALATTCTMLQEDSGPPLDDLCCGTAGSIDILLECARLLNRPDLAQTAQREAQRRVQAWTAHDNRQAVPRYWFHGKDMAGTSLSLFKGITGQTYLQARLAAPQEIPCVLLPL